MWLPENCANKNSQTMPVTETTPILVPYLAQRLGGVCAGVCVCFLKQELPEQKTDLCSKQFGGPPIAQVLHNNK